MEWNNLPAEMITENKTYQENLNNIQKQYWRTNYNPKETQKFSEFLSWHPCLYDGVELDKATIDFLNNYFWDYSVKPQEFERKYLQALRRATGIYKNMKAIELVDQVFDITTNETVRQYTRQAVNELSQTGNVTSNSTSTNSQTVTDDSNTKTAQKTLPMNSEGDFDELFEWDGGSGISETRDEDESRTSGSGSINSTDTRNLLDLGNQDINDKETIKIVGDQAVKLVSNIWNYLLAPKAIDYLVNELEKCFVLVYGRGE